MIQDNIMRFDQFKKVTEVRNPKLTYTDEEDKVIVQLQSYNSQSYTKLAQKIEKVKQLEEEIKELKQEVMQLGRDNVDELFDASDAASTRVVETVSFIFKLTKDPKPTEAPKYKDILEELSTHLTPQLIKVLTEIKGRLVTTTQKKPALSFTDKTKVEEGLNDMMQSIGGVFSRFLKQVLAWADRYDEYLAKLKLEAQYLDD